MRNLIFWAGLAILGCNTATAGQETENQSTRAPILVYAPDELPVPTSIPDTARSASPTPAPPDAGAPVEQAPPDEAPPGYHESQSGDCYLPDTIKAGTCKCQPHYGADGKLYGGTICPLGCTHNETGETIALVFCYDAGLPTDYHPR